MQIKCFIFIGQCNMGRIFAMAKFECNFYLINPKLIFRHNFYANPLRDLNVSFFYSHSTYNDFVDNNFAD